MWEANASITLLIGVTTTFDEVHKRSYFPLGLAISLRRQEERG